MSVRSKNRRPVSLPRPRSPQEERKPWKPKQTDRFDLSRHGLGHLAGQDVLTLAPNDLDKLLTALGEDDIAVRVPISSTPENMERLLASSECRRCGECCCPVKPNPDNPGIEALEDELHKLADKAGMSYEQLVEKTTRGKPVFHPSYMENVSFTRYLPRPCPFYDVEGKGCPVHSVRPIVCRLHPIVFGDYGQISIRAKCDYGKDILKAAFKEVRETQPGVVMRV